MSFQTNAARQGGYYGRLVYDSNNKNYEFEKLGREVVLERVTHNIENDDASLRLSFDYMGERRRLTILRKELADNTLIQTLAAKGADVTKKHFDILVDTLRQQEDEMEFDGYGLEKVYTHLGWLNLPTFSDTGQITGSLLCYRADKLVGAGTAKYAGDYSVSPKGSLDAWCEMVRAEVLGSPVLELVLIAALSAVVNGLISSHTTGENPIVHICCASGKGKTTALYLAASVSGEPYDGERRVTQRNGAKTRRCSIYGSWGATENATIAQCAGNKGAVIILNELGKFKGSKDMSRIVYDLSEGTDKARLNADMETKKSEGYSTTILSSGEISLLGRCADKLEGLQSRVMEIEQPLTNDADHSRRIKEACRRNNGWAAPVLAQYIIDNGGADLVLNVYRESLGYLDGKMPDSPSKARFTEKFAALFLTTATLAMAALGIHFNVDGLVQFLAEYEAEKGQERNTSASSYDAIIEACRVNKRSFFVDGEPIPTTKSYGRIKYPNRLLDDGCVITEQYEIRRSFLEKVLKDNGYPNIRTCATQWKAMGVLDYEAGHLTRSRKIDREAGAAEDVFVFLVFEAAPPRNPRRSVLAGEGGDKDE